MMDGCGSGVKMSFFRHLVLLDFFSMASQRCSNKKISFPSKKNKFPLGEVAPFISLIKDFSLKFSFSAFDVRLCWKTFLESVLA